MSTKKLPRVRSYMPERAAWKRMCSARICFIEACHPGAGHFTREYVAQCVSKAKDKGLYAVNTDASHTFISRWVMMDLGRGHGHHAYLQWHLDRKLFWRIPEPELQRMLNFRIRIVA